MRLKRKIPAFVFGVSIGIIIGGGFFIFKINEIFNRFNDNAKSQITVIEQPVKEVNPKEAEKKSPREKFKINLSSSKSVDYREADSLIKEGSELNVATEELLSVKTVKVIRIDGNSSQTDSTGNPVSVAHFSNEPYFIEYWKTPLNSKGYRFTKNKILLYGFMDYSNAQLYELDNSFYIKSNDQVYRLFYSSDFRPLERVFDSELLAKIN